MPTSPTQPEQTKKNQIPSLCPVWSANFRALQTEHTNLSTETQTQLTTTLSQPTTTKQKFATLQPIVKKLESLAEKLESTYQKTLEATLFHDISPEHRELIETDLLPQYRHWLKQSHKNPEPINPDVQPKFCGYDQLKYDEATDRYFYEGGKTQTILQPDGSLNEKLSDTPETIAVYEKFAGRKFNAPTEAEFIARIKPGLAGIQAMKKEHGAVKIVFSCIGNSVRANAAIFDREKENLSLPGYDKLINSYVENSIFADREVNEGTAKYYGELEFDESEGARTITTQPETGVSLEQLIEQTNGFLLTITPDVKELPLDPAVIYVYGKSGEVNYNVTILKKNWEKLKRANQRALSPHEELAFLQSQVADGKTSDKNTYTALLGVDTKKSSRVAIGNWRNRQTYLGWCNTYSQHCNLRLRGSVGIF